MEQTGQTISLVGNGKYKGAVTHNGTLLKLHDFSFVTGFSSLTAHATIVPSFGFGVFHDAALRNNQIFQVAADCTTPVFAGVLARNPAIASGQPAANKSILSYNKSDLVKEGFLVFKTGFVAATGAETLGFADVQVGMNMYINNANGRPTFATTAPATHTLAGRVVSMNPDDQSWTVKVSV